MRVTAIIVFFCSLMFGCSANHSLRSPLEANRKPITDRAEIVLRSGDRIDAVDIKVGNDVTQYVPVGTDSLRQVRTNEIDKLIVTDHIAGAVGGFLAGGAVGIGAGILLSVWTGELGEGNGNMNMMPFIYVTGGLAVGSIGGTIYGAMHGPQDHYVFPPDSIKGLTKGSAFDTTDRRLVKSVLEESNDKSQK